MVEALGVASTVVSVLNGTFTLGRTFFQLKNVPEDVKTAVNDLAGIQKDLNDARKLRNRKFDVTSPGFKGNSLLEDIKRAINTLASTVRECQEFLEAPRVDQEAKGSVTIANRVLWVIDGKDNYSAKKFFLSMDHNRLMSLMNTMRSLPDVSTAGSSPPSYAEATLGNTEFSQYLSPAEKRRRMRSQSVEDLHKDSDSDDTAVKELQSPPPSSPPCLPKASSEPQQATKAINSQQDESSSPAKADDVDEAFFRRRKRFRRS